MGQKTDGGGGVGGEKYLCGAFEYRDFDSIDEVQYTAQLNDALRDSWEGEKLESTNS